MQAIDTLMPKSQDYKVESDDENELEKYGENDEVGSDDRFESKSDVKQSKKSRGYSKRETEVDLKEEITKEINEDICKYSKDIICTNKPEEEGKYDCPSQIDFDPEALALNKDFFQDYSEGEEQAEKIQYLERNFEFLQTQHQNVMSCLHQEVDDLKQKNLELNLKLTQLISQTQANDKGSKYYKGKDPSRLTQMISNPPNAKDNSGLRMLKLVTEVENLKESLTYYKQENKMLTNVLQRYTQQSSCEGKEVEHEDKNSCHSIIKHLNEINEHNINKIIRLKDDLYGALNDQDLPLSAFMKSKGLGEEEGKVANTSILKRFTLPKLSKLKRNKQNNNNSIVSESSSGKLLPPLRNPVLDKDRLSRPHFKP